MKLESLTAPECNHELSPSKDHRAIGRAADEAVQDSRDDLAIAEATLGRPRRSRRGTGPCRPSPGSRFRAGPVSRRCSDRGSRHPAYTVRRPARRQRNRCSGRHAPKPPRKVEPACGGSFSGSRAHRTSSNRAIRKDLRAVTGSSPEEISSHNERLLIAAAL